MTREFDHLETDPRISPYIKSPENKDWIPVPETVKKIWRDYGPEGIKSFEDYARAKTEFESKPQIEVLIRGGGPSALLMTKALLKTDPLVHITIVEKADRLGGMGINAISPFVENHISTIISQQKLIFQTVSEPRVNAITNYPVSLEELPDVARMFNAQIVIDAAGAPPNKLENTLYGNHIMTSNDYLNYVNGKFIEEGHFGNVNVPVERDDRGAPYPTIIAAGGNQSRDLQKANELVILADRWQREFGLPKELLDIEKVSKEGIRTSRLKMGLADDSSRETILLYRGLDWKMKKLLKGAGNLEYGDPRLREAMAGEILKWEMEDGGRFVSMHEIKKVEDQIRGPLLVTVRNNETGKDDIVEAGNVITAIRFEPRHQADNTLLIGIAVSGAADLSSTGLYIIKNALPKVKARLALAKEMPYFRHDLSQTDPVNFAVTHGPQYIIGVGFRKK